MPKHLVEPNSSLARSASDSYQVKGAHNKLTSKEASTLLGRARKLGVSIAVFERQCGFRPGRLRAWAKLFAATARADAARPAFVRVAVEAKPRRAIETLVVQPPNPIRIIVRDVTLEIPSSFSKDTLLQLLDVLESRS